MARKHQGIEPTRRCDDPGPYFETASRRLARDRLSSRLAERSRLAVITADAGAGKTWLMRRVLSEAPADHTRCECGARDGTRARDILLETLEGLGGVLHLVRREGGVSGIADHLEAPDHAALELQKACIPATEGPTKAHVVHAHESLPVLVRFLRVVLLQEKPVPPGTRLG